MRTLVICLLCAVGLQAETISELMGGSLGRPSAPPILGFLAIASPGPYSYGHPALEFDVEGREVLRPAEGANHVGRISTTGRLLSLDYRQGPDDSLQSREEFSYSGNEVTHKRLKADGTILTSVITTLDTAGRVVNAKIQSPGTQPITVIFSYDSRGRLLRQEATDLPRPAGDPLGTVSPGLVTITGMMKNTRSAPRTASRDRLSNRLSHLTLTAIPSQRSLRAF